jgi:hypothetical protein
MLPNSWCVSCLEVGGVSPIDLLCFMLQVRCSCSYGSMGVQAAVFDCFWLGWVVRGYCACECVHCLLFLWPSCGRHMTFSVPRVACNQSRVRLMLLHNGVCRCSSINICIRAVAWPMLSSARAAVHGMHVVLLSTLAVRHKCNQRVCSCIS